MKTILNLTEDTTLNGFRVKRNLMVTRVKTEASTVNSLIMSEINMGSLAKQLKKGKDAKAATATLVWRAVRAIIEAQGLAVDGIVMPDDVPAFIGRKLGRKLHKLGLSLYKVNDLR